MSEKQVHPSFGRVEPKFGVLLVHGMGEQKRGDTLLQFGEPMITWIRRAIAPGSASDLDAEPCIMDSEVIRVHGQDLGQPAHLTLRWTAAPDKPWLVTESWWAADFRPASFLDLVKWGIRIAPFALNDTLQHQLRTKPGVFFFSGQLPLTVVLGPIVHILLLLLLPLSYFPFLRGVAGSMIQRLTNSFGDPYLLLSSPIRFSSMVERIHHDIRWMKEQGCSEIAIVAHSQGASVSHRALKTLPGTTQVNVQQFVTFGAAIKKLYLLRQVDYEGSRRLRWGIGNTIVVLVMLTVVLFFWRVGTTGIGGHDLDPGWVVLTVWVLGTAIYWLFARKATEPLKSPKELAEATKLTTEPGAPKAWLDFYARADPVSLGALPLDATAGHCSKEIRNRDSIPVDHTYYWRNVEQFVGPVCRSLMVAAGWPIEDYPVLQPTKLKQRFTDRERRVNQLVWAFRMAFATWVALGVELYLLDRIEEVGSPIREGARIAGEELTIPFEGFIKSSIGNGPVAQSVYGVLVLLITTVVWYSIVTGMWERWNSTQTDKSFTEPDPAPKEGSGWFVNLTLATPVVVAAVAVLVCRIW